jgi:hypothetical protein
MILPKLLGEYRASLSMPARLMLFHRFLLFYYGIDQTEGMFAGEQR